MEIDRMIKRLKEIKNIKEELYKEENLLRMNIQLYLDEDNLKEYQCEEGRVEMKTHITCTYAKLWDTCKELFEKYNVNKRDYQIREEKLYVMFDTKPARKRSLEKGKKKK